MDQEPVRVEPGPAQLTPEGFLRARATPIARVGVQRYLNQDGSERLELRIPEEVFHQDSMDSADGKPVTRGHPKGKGVVTAANARKLSRGTASTPRQDGDFLRADLIIHDEETIKAVQDGEAEVSAGYFSILEPIPGGIFRRDGHPLDGTRADFLQTRINHNHVAVLKRGRANTGVASRPVRIRLDGEMDMPMIKIAGRDYDVPDEVAAYIGQLRTDMEALQRNGGMNLPDGPIQAQAQITQLRAELASMQARKDEAEGKLEMATRQIAELKKDGNEEADKAKRAEAERQRFAQLSRASKVLNKPVEELVHLDGEELDREVAGKLVPGVDLKGRSPEYVQGVLAMAEGKKAQRADASQELVQGVREPGSGSPEVRADKAYDAYRQAQLGQLS